ncbi:hypothetical protein D3C87_2057550 [compost metagenome]
MFRSLRFSKTLTSGEALTIVRLVLWQKSLRMFRSLALQREKLPFVRWRLFDPFCCRAKRLCRCLAFLPIRFFERFCSGMKSKTASPE